MGTVSMTCKEVMLIDDSTIDNFVSQKIIEHYGFASTITAYTKARKALDRLANAGPGDDLPEIIFLDLNMPGMNGFQFLAEFHRLDAHVRERCRIVVLSSTVNPSEVQLTMRNHDVLDFYSKPLMKDNLSKLAQRLREEALQVA